MFALMQEHQPRLAQALFLLNYKTPVLQTKHVLGDYVQLKTSTAAPTQTAEPTHTRAVHIARIAMFTKTI